MGTWKRFQCICQNENAQLQNYFTLRREESQWQHWWCHAGGHCQECLHCTQVKMAVFNICLQHTQNKQKETPVTDQSHREQIRTSDFSVFHLGILFSHCTCIIFTLYDIVGCSCGPFPFTQQKRHYQDTKCTFSLRRTTPNTTRTPQRCII